MFGGHVGQRPTEVRHRIGPGHMVAEADIEVGELRNAFCGQSSSDVGDQYETPTLEDVAAEVGRFPRYELV